MFGEALFLRQKLMIGISHDWKERKLNCRGFRDILLGVVCARLHSFADPEEWERGSSKMELRGNKGSYFSIPFLECSIRESVSLNETGVLQRFLMR